MCRVGWATTRGNNSRIGDEIKPFFLARLASNIPGFHPLKCPEKCTIGSLGFSYPDFDKKKRYNPLSLIRFRLERFDSRSFRSAHNSRLDDFSPPDTHISTIYFSLRLTLISWIRSIVESRCFVERTTIFFRRRKEEKKINANPREQGEGKKRRKIRADARSKSKGKTELRHARHPNVTRYIRNERENEYECWDH